MLTLQEVTSLLKRFSFEGLSLISMDEEKLTYNFKFTSFNPVLMPVKPTVAAGGKVLVFTVPDVGKFGVSPANFMVRYVDSGLRHGTSSSVPEGHLTKQELPADLVLAYQKAVVNSGQRVAFVTKLWHHFNTTKFSGQMQVPKLEVSSHPSFGGVAKSTRGAFLGDPGWHPGRLWMASFMFNSRIAFFCEVFLHEMCHLAAWCLSCSDDFSEGGHGPVWQQWMTHVGLDPRRFDPTDDYEYQDDAQRQATEVSLTQQYGPRSPSKDVKALKKMKGLEPGPAIYLQMGRILHGTIGLHNGRSPYFEYKNKAGGTMFMSWPDAANFARQGLPNLYHETAK